MQFFFKEIKILVNKEIRLELKQQYMINSMLLYVAATVFVIYLSFAHMADTTVWNALLWIVILFAAINATGKSFVQENIGRQLYYYTLASPQAIICSKIIYNSLLLIVLSLLCFLFFSVLMGNRVSDYLFFSLVLIFGSIGFSAVLTLVSAISSRSGNNFALMAILSFPILLPLLLILIKLSSGILMEKNLMDSLGYFLVLFLLDLLAIALAYILFPYLWND